MPAERGRSSRGCCRRAAPAGTSPPFSSCSNLPPIPPTKGRGEQFFFLKHQRVLMPRNSPVAPQKKSKFWIRLSSNQHLQQSSHGNRVSLLFCCSRDGTANSSSIQLVSQQQRVEQRRFNDQPGNHLPASASTPSFGEAKSKANQENSPHVGLTLTKSALTRDEENQNSSSQIPREEPPSGGAARSDQTPAEDHAAGLLSARRRRSHRERERKRKRKRKRKRQRAVPARGRIHPPGGRSSRRDRPPPPGSARPGGPDAVPPPVRPVRGVERWWWWGGRWGARRQLSRAAGTRSLMRCAATVASLRCNSPARLLCSAGYS